MSTFGSALHWRCLPAIALHALSNLDSGNFVWANFGKRLEFSDAAGEAALIQKLMDGGVYVVSDGKSPSGQSKIDLKADHAL